MPKGERIARRLARVGLCSRREAERWIEAGRVVVDGKTLDTPAFTVTAASRIVVDGKPLPDAEPAALWRYHKPGGLVTTNRDPQGRTTIFERLPPGLPRVMTVGRLDLTTEGLLLLTNDGALARHLELPSTGWSRRYRVRVHGAPDQNALKALGDGITISGIHYGPITARLDRQQGSNAWLTFVIREGKNREIRRVCEHLGLTVNRLIRTGYGPFELGDLAPGTVAQVPARILRDQLGTALPDLDFGSTDKPAAGAKSARPAVKGQLALKGKPSAKDRPPAKGRPGAGRPDSGKRPFGDRPVRSRDGEPVSDRRADKPFRAADGPTRGKRPDSAAKPGGAKRPFGDRPNRSRDAEARDDRSARRPFRAADGAKRGKRPEGDPKPGGLKPGGTRSAGSKRRFADRPARGKGPDGAGDRTPDPAPDRPFRPADGPARGKGPGPNAKSGSPKRSFGDRTDRTRDPQSAGDRRPDKPFRSADGPARGKGPGPGGKPGGPERPGGPRQERGGKPARRFENDEPQAKRGASTPRPEPERTPRRDHKAGPKSGPAKPASRSGPGRPRSDASPGAPAEENATNAPTGRSRGSARRRKTVDANRRRSS